MLPTVKHTLTAAVTALTLTAVAAVPAHAGRNEDNFLKGVAAALVVGAIIKNAQKRPQAVQPQPIYRVQPSHPAPQPTYGRVIGGHDGYRSTSVYATPAAQAFNTYTVTERRAIQRRLAAFGYYGGGIDAAFGPATYRAVTEWARDQGLTQQLASRDGAFAVYDRLVY